MLYPQSLRIVGAFLINRLSRKRLIRAAPSVRLEFYPCSDPVEAGNIRKLLQILTEIFPIIARGAPG
jgi:hypothetical protein